MKKQFIIVKRLGFYHIHVDCSSSHKAAEICDSIARFCPIEVCSFNFSKETQSVIVAGKETFVPLSDEELNELVDNALQKVV